MRRTFTSLLWVPLALFGPACAAANTLSGDERAQGWQLLFDGRSLRGWHSFHQQGTGKDWSVADDAIQLEHDPGASPADFADLVSDKEYGNFDLRLEWKMTPCADSGVFFYVQESPAYRTTYETGPEMQIADRTCTDPDSFTPREHSGELFDLISTDLENVKDSGAWNAIEIIVDHGHVRFFQNGHETVDTRLWTPQWSALVAPTKFAQMPDFARRPKGHIALQGAEPKGRAPIRVWFRNIRIRELD